MSEKPRSIWVVVLAGGDGPRLPALAFTPRERTITVVLEAHRGWWAHECFASPRSPVVVQPCNRGTGLGVLLALLVIAKSDPDAGVMFISSDQYVEHEAVLAEYLREATAPEVMDSDKLTLLGIFPYAPDSGFGYLSPAPDSGVGLRPVLDFVEKPAQASAELIRAGSVWNNGIVAGRISQFLALYPRHTRQMILDLRAIVEHWPDSRIPSAELIAFYSRHSALDFFRDVLRKRPDRLQVLNATASDRAAFKPGPSPAPMIESDYPQVAQRGFAWVAQSPRLAPYEEC